MSENRLGSLILFELTGKFFGELLSRKVIVVLNMRDLLGLELALQFNHEPSTIPHLCLGVSHFGPQPIDPYLFARHGSDIGSNFGNHLMDHVTRPLQLEIKWNCLSHRFVDRFFDASSRHAGVTGEISAETDAGHDEKTYQQRDGEFEEFRTHDHTPRSFSAEI
jgi:hypothetical protein